jgi:ATP-dependent protease ClpP protease subunit
VSRNQVDQQEILLPQHMFEKQVKHYKQVVPVNFHHFYITGDIDDDVDKYLDMINEIKMAEPHDQVFIYLNTPGGSLSTTIQIISAINQSQATVTTSIESEVCSAGTLLFLSGDQYIVNDNCSFMIHNYSHGPVGKGNEVAQRVKFTEEYFRKLAQNLYKDFLTENEIEDVCEGKDIWMDSNEVKKRLENKKLISQPFDEPLESEEPPKKRTRKASTTRKTSK